MGLWDNIALALVSLRANKMRALLTMLGIIIGVGSVIAIMTVGDSLTGSITESMSGLGISNITVSLTEKDDDESASEVTASGVQLRMFGPSNPGEEDLMTDEMIAEYRGAFGEEIAAISLTENMGSATVTVAGEDYTVSVSGVNTDYKNASELNMLCGRFINQADLDGERRNCVIADRLVDDIFGESVSDASVLGQELSMTINRRLYSFYIAGVYEYEEAALSFSTGDVVTSVYIPITTAKLYNSSADGYQSFTVVSSAVDNTAFMNQTQSFFASYYTRNESYTVEASSMESMVSTITDMLGTVKLAIMAIAAISLLVGGIGVMNIMMVSITERTREIGTRKALGAPNSAIRLQFIVESVIICLIGGLIGIAVGVGGGMLASNLLGYAAQPSLMAILAATGFSMAIGVFFGYYPANKAARLDPIEALRYE